MCLSLAVSTFGFYHWPARPRSATAACRQALTARIPYYFEESDGTYGHRRVHADLAAEQTECSPELVRLIMHYQGPAACQPRPSRVTTEADAEAAAGMPGLLKRDFTADRPGVKFVGAITYIHTWQGFVYLATDTTLTEPAAIWHSDRGSVYTSTDFRALVTRLGMRSSMGRTGVWWETEWPNRSSQP